MMIADGGWWQGIVVGSRQPQSINHPLCWWHHAKRRVIVHREGEQKKYRVICFMVMVIVIAMTIMMPLSNNSKFKSNHRWQEQRTRDEETALPPDHIGPSSSMDLRCGDCIPPLFSQSLIHKKCMS